jgi:hypothetical protein
MTIHFGAPQLIWAALIVVNLVLGGFLHGKPKLSKHNVWTDVVTAVLSFGLLYWGGFFKG